MAATEPGENDPPPIGVVDNPIPPPAPGGPPMPAHAFGGAAPFFDVGPGRYVPTSVRRKLFQRMMQGNSQPQLFDLNVDPSYMAAMGNQGGW